MKKNLNLWGGIGGFCFTAVILLTAFCAGEMYPFGTGTLSWCDMNQQLIPLFCDLKDILSGEASLFLNTANAGGMNFYGVFFFFLSSPFSLSVAFVDKVDIPFLMNVLVVLKLSLAAFFAGFTLSRLNKGLRPLTVSALSSAYALCGYGMLFYQNIMWLDLMYLFPLVVLGAVRLTKGRPALLSVSLTLCVIFNFYISYMVYIFVLLFFGAYALIYRKADRKIYVNLGLSAASSLLASAFVWLPCLLQYTASARGGGLIAGLKEANFLAPFETTLTVILQSGLILAALFYMLPRLSVAEKRIKLIFLLFILTAIPLLIEPVNMMWHTGSYMSFPARYGFITVFIGILLAARLFEAQDSVNVSRIRGLIYTIPIVLLGVFTLLFATENRKTISHYVGTLWGDRNSLQGQAVIFLCFGICYIGVVWLMRKKTLCRRVASLLLCAVVMLEGLCSAELFMNSAKGQFGLYGYKSVMALKEDDEGSRFYRVNTKNKLTDANMTGAAGFASLGHYTSLNNATYMEAAKKLGLSSYWMETGNWGGSILSDALLSVGYTVSYDNGDYTKLKNPYYLGLGIKAKGEIPKAFPEGDRLISTGKAFSSILDCENPVIKYAPKFNEDCQITELDGGYIISVHSNSGVIGYDLKITEPTTLYFDCYNGFSNNLVEEINNSFAVYVDGELLEEAYPTSRNNGPMCLGSFKDREVNITLKVLEDVHCLSFGVFGVKENAVKAAVDGAQALNLTQDGSVIKGQAQKGSYFISIPKSDGLKVTLNDKKLDYKTALEGFISLDLKNGGELEIFIIPKGLYIGIAMSVLGLLILALFLSKAKKGSAIYAEPVANVFYGMFLGVALIAALSVYIIPIIINLSDFKL